MALNDSDSSDSEYEVEQYITAKRVKRSVNDDSADLLGNFDDEKRKEILEGTYKEPEDHRNPSDSEDLDEDEEGETNGNDDDGESDEDNDEEKTNLTKEQVTSLLRGAAKVNRHVLYVTNLNFETTGDDLAAHFGPVGAVKSVRIPKKRRGGFAFVEMADLDGYQRGLQLHNTELQGRQIKVQISEAGKKKSANKKNILKQKNRKLAEMRNENKAFTKSGKFYDKSLSKEKAKEKLVRNRWRKTPNAKGGVPRK